jgi:lysophospholipase L1-like esterase
MEQDVERARVDLLESRVNLALAYARGALDAGAIPNLPANPKIMFLGDSTTSGSNGLYTGLVGGYPARTIQTLLGLRSDFEVIGSQIELAENAAGCNVPYSEGHTGFTIAQLTAGYAGFCASPGVGVPDLVIFMAGTNDMVAGRTLVQMEADYAAARTEILTVGPATRIIWMPPMQFQDGTTTHATLAALQALQASVVAFLAAWAPEQKNSYYNASSQLAGSGQTLVDGVHPNLSGEAIIGDGLAAQLDIWLGPRRRLPIPRVFLTRQTWASEECITDTTDGLTCTAHPGFNPGAGSFTLVGTYAMGAVPAAGTYAIFSYGTYAVNNYYGLLLVSDGTTAHLRLYWDNTTVTIGGATASFAESPGLLANSRNRIMIQADASTGTVGLYVNGQLAGLAQGIGPWTNTQQTFYVALDATFGSGAVGFYQEVQAYKAVPARPGSVAALQAALGDYYQRTAPIAGEGSAYFTLDGTLADDVYAPGDPNPNMVAHGGMAAVGAYPAGTPLMPWNWQNAGPGM